MFSKKWLIRFGLAFIGLLLLAFAAVYADWKIARNRGQEMLDKEIAKVDAEDPDWRAADLCAKRNVTVPPVESNSGSRAMQAYDLIPKDYHSWKRDCLKEATDSPGILADEKDLAQATARHRDVDKAILVARSIRALPQGKFSLTYKEPDLIGTSIEPTARVRQISALLDHDAFVLAHANEGNEALRTLQAMVYVGRAISDEPFLISQIIRVATTMIAYRATLRTLGLCEPTQGLVELQTAFAEELTVPRLTYGFRGERALFHHLLENFDDGSIYSMDDPSRNASNSRLQSAPFRRSIPKQQAIMLEYFGRLLAAEKLFGKERIEAFEAIRPPIVGKDMPLVQLFLPAVDKMLVAENRVRAAISTTVIALACERFRLANGRFPKAMAEIPKSILPTVPYDPFTGDPLYFKTLDDGIVIYSVGADLVDDGGENLDLTAKEGGDIGFKLLHPTKRRQPAPPRPSVPADELIDP